MACSKWTGSTPQGGHSGTLRINHHDSTFSAALRLIAAQLFLNRVGAYQQRFLKKQTELVSQLGQ
jgi:hypothetical protein